MTDKCSINELLLTHIREFNELVNMTSQELRDWLKQERSQSAGWQGESGETIGHERYVHISTSY